MKPIQVNPVDPKVKAGLTLLIKQILDCKTLEEVHKVLKTWTDANDLHPEDVITISDSGEVS